MKPAATDDPSPGPRSVPTYVEGLDFILDGGLPAGRTTLLVGGPGSGKSILASEFILRGATQGLSGLLVSFDETPEQFAADLAGMDLPLQDRLDDGSVAIHFVDPASVTLPSSGAFTLDGLFLQVGTLLDSLGDARRVAFDGLESFFAAAPDRATTRSEMRRLFHWLNDRGVTAMVTSERGTEGRLTRWGLEEYLSDCVILLEYAIEERVATRRLRVLKRRGGGHSGDEHPFLITDRGLELFPLISSKLTHDALAERVSTGVGGLDELMEGKGYYRGSSILVSGTPGAGKSSVAAAFVTAACLRGETALYYAFEESPAQILRNMGSLGYDLAPHVEEGSLHIRAQRPSEFGLEYHLIRMARDLKEIQPDVVVLDPFSSLTGLSFKGTARSMMVRLVDLLKDQQVTALFTSLGTTASAMGTREEGPVISSLMDTWLVLESRRVGGERTRFLWVLKSRGMGHSTGFHELVVSDTGIAVADAEEAPGDLGEPGG